MPEKTHMTLILALCLLLCGITIPAAVSAEGLAGHWISSSTSVSGQAVVNETATLKMTTFTGDLLEKKEWKYSDTFSATQRNAWGSNLFLGTTENTLMFQYSRMGRIPPFSIHF